MAAAQRIGPYEVLEPSSEEVEKVREGRGKEAPSKQGPQGNNEAAAWRVRGRAATEGPCASLLPHEEGLRGGVPETEKEVLDAPSPSKRARMRREGAGDRTENHRGWEGEAALPGPVILPTPCPSEPASVLHPGPDVPRAGGCF